MAAVTHMMHMPVSYGRAPAFANYEAKVALWNQIPTTESQKPAPNLLLRMTDAAKAVSM